LRKAVSEKFKRENNLDYSPDQVIVSAGAKNSLANVILALIDKGDEVIVPSPYWVTYVELVTLAEGKNVIIKGAFENDFKVTPEQIAAAITPKTKALLLCSPSNPTGSVYSKDGISCYCKGY
jgi:aspartate aminotransferase